MAVSGNFYRNAIANAFLGKMNVTSDALKVMLCTSSYAPNLDTDQFKSAVTNEVSGTGYTATGVALGSPTCTYTAANSYGTSRANTTAYTVGQIVRPATGNGFLYQCSTAGTSGSSVPTYPTVIGQTVTDGTVTWTCVGSGIIQLGGANVSWATSTITARYAVLYDSTPSTDATRPLIALINFGADMSSTAGTFQITWDPSGIAYILVA